jgi:hypothetical protein
MDIGGGSVCDENAKLWKKEFARGVHQVHSVRFVEIQCRLGERGRVLASPRIRREW